MPRAEIDRAWVVPALAIVLSITAMRLLLLAFDRTDLFVDETQYWLWGQQFDFGYYSKPPLIAWVIGGVTALAGSDAPFWVRMPGSILHAATALILAALAARIYGSRVALWVAALYMTLPMVSLGSLLISTDTVMAPFFAAALYFHRRLIESGALRFALLAGAMAGFAFLAKYAGVYFLIGVALAALFFREMRLGLGNALGLLLAFGLVIAPNVLWNLQNGFATASHTMDNVGWVREASPLAQLNPMGMAEFFFSQFGVFGPILFGALLWAALRPGPARPWQLLVFSIPAIAIVTLQALLDRAYANWAVSAYFAGTIVAVATMTGRTWLLWGSLAFNVIVAVVLPTITVLPELHLGRDEPIAARYLGRADLSEQILARAKAEGLPVIADRRDVLADLFYTGRDSGVQVFAVPPRGRPLNHYEQSYPMPDEMRGAVLYVGTTAPVCEGVAALGDPLDVAGGGYADTTIFVFKVDAGCLDAR
jgi:hypothetical protein